MVTTELKLTTRAGAPVSYFDVRVAPLSQDLILVLADDTTGARRTIRSGGTSWPTSATS